MSTSRASAWLAGRDFITPDDVKALAVPTLQHRLQLHAEAELEGVTASSVLTSVLAKSARAALAHVPHLARAGAHRGRAGPGHMALHPVGGCPVDGRRTLSWCARSTLRSRHRRGRSPCAATSQAQVRLTESASSTLTILNVGRRQIHGGGSRRVGALRGRGRQPPPHGRSPARAPPRRGLAFTATRRGDRRGGRGDSSGFMRLITARGPPVVHRRPGPTSRPARVPVTAPPAVAAGPLRRRARRPLRGADPRRRKRVRLAARIHDVGDDVRSIDWRATAAAPRWCVRAWRPNATATSSS